MHTYFKKKCFVAMKLEEKLEIAQQGYTLSTTYIKI